MKNIKTVIPAIAILFLAGCTSIEARTLDDETNGFQDASVTAEPAGAITTTSTTTTTAATTTTTEATTAATEFTTTTAAEEITTEETTDSSPEETTAPETEETDAPQTIVESYDSYTFDDVDQAFLSETVFVGDSICRGLSAYGIIDSSQVLAQGNVGARSIFEYTFSYGGSDLELLTALVNSNPKNIVFSMGMNDVNMTSAEKFVENYTHILSMTASYLPDTRLIIAGITPVTEESNFVANSKIREYNQALMNMAESSEIPVTVVDLFDVLANSTDALKSNYHSGDGIHLSPAAYYAYLWKICQTCLHSGGASVSTDVSDVTATGDNEYNYDIDEDVITHVDVTAE